MEPQQRLVAIDFLLTQARFGLTLLDTARITSDPDHARHCRALALEAYETVNRFRSAELARLPEDQELMGVMRRLRDGLSNHEKRE